MADKPEEMSFEEALERLEALVAELERGELPLEESVRAYEEGVRLVRRCEKLLADAEARIRTLGDEGETPPDHDD